MADQFVLKNSRGNKSQFVDGRQTGTYLIVGNILIALKVRGVNGLLVGVQAIDYLLKPFDEERFKRALNRARREWETKRSSEKVLSKLLESVRPQRHYLHRLVANSGGRVLFLKLADIDWIEATGNYVTLHAGKESHMVRTSMNALEPRLDPTQFVRIHRCSIVNSDRVREMQPLFRGEHVLMLKNGTQLNVGRAFRRRLLQQMGSNVS